MEFRQNNSEENLITVLKFEIQIMSRRILLFWLLTVVLGLRLNPQHGEETREGLKYIEGLRDKINRTIDGLKKISRETTRLFGSQIKLNLTGLPRSSEASNEVINWTNVQPPRIGTPTLVPTTLPAAPQSEKNQPHSQRE